MWPTGAQGQAEVQWHHCSSESTVSRLPECHASGETLILCRYGINKNHVHVCCQLLCIVCTIVLSVSLRCLCRCAVCTIAQSVPLRCLYQCVVCTIALSVTLRCLYQCIVCTLRCLYHCTIGIADLLHQQQSKHVVQIQRCCDCLLPFLAPRLLQYMTARAFKLIA